MKWYYSNLVKALAAAVVVIIVLEVVGTPENSEKIYDFFHAKPLAPEPQKPDPEAEKAALRLEHDRLAASVPLECPHRVVQFEC
ncbi:MAG: hypothetical protein P8P56_08370 [Yoonia sp.]|nr:hypothetical protein [Yoonia sp.]MDG1862733.1 hypothetical protein [Yoonia sp.]